MGIRYSTEGFFTKTIIRMDDPVFTRPWYLKSVNDKGGYTWTSDPLYARQFSEKTAMKHRDTLASGADAEWKQYSKIWADYYRKIGIL